MPSPGNPTMPAIPSGGAFGYTATVDDPLYDPSTHAAAAVASEVAANGSYAATTTDVLRTRVTTDANPRFTLNADGTLEWGDGTLAADTNLFRAAADLLKTDDTFQALRAGLGLAPTAGDTLGVVAGSSAALRVGAAADGTTAVAGVLFGLSGDTNLYRSAANTLKTDDELRSAVEVIARAGVGGHTQIGLDGSSRASIQFGSSLDTNLYRSSAGVLSTDGDFKLATSSKVFGVVNIANTITSGTDLNIKEGNTGRSLALSGKVGINFQADLVTKLTLAATTLTFADAVDIVLNATTGTKIGTATTQKLAFYNATPIVQGASIADPSGGAIIDAEARTAIIALISRIEALGLIATV